MFFFCAERRRNEQEIAKSYGETRRYTTGFGGLSRTSFLCFNSLEDLWQDRLEKGANREGLQKVQNDQGRTWTYLRKGGMDL